MVASEDRAPEFVWIARIRRPQGRKGEVWAEILTDFPEKFETRRELFLLADPPQSKGLPRPATLENHWLHKGGIVLHFAGIDSISAAETLSGLLVAIPQSERAPLGEDEAYIGDLVGCTVLDLSANPPAEIGKIEDVDRTAGPVALLVLRGANDREILIPFAKSYLKKIDLEARRIEMTLPEGLLDLN